MTSSAASASLDVRDRLLAPTRPSALRRVWGEVWRVALAGIAGILALVVVFGFSIDEGLIADSVRTGAVLVIDIVLGATAIALLPLRRLAPVTVGVLLALIGGFSLLSLGAVGIAVISVATRRRRGGIVAVGLAGLVSVGVVESLGWSLIGVPSTPVDLIGSVAATAVIVSVLVLIGLHIGGRRDLIRSLRERARRARLDEEEQARRLAHERDEERTRIAREMHDVLAHRLSLVALHAGALQHRGDLDREETARTAGIVRDNARAALDELREVLGVLRQAQPSTGPELPQPSLAELPGLVEEAREDGAVVILDIAEEIIRQPSIVPSPTGRHVFRIVQEALTNARRHAPGHPVTVRIGRHQGDRLRVRVSNDLPAATPAPIVAGHGLVGIQERARSLGGSFTLRRDGGAHEIDVLLPWQAS